MIEPVETKTCGMCSMEIAATAKKCPYCQHWQHRLSMLAFHPGFAAIFALIPLLIGAMVVGTMFQSTFDPGADFQAYAEQIKVVQSQISFGENDCGPTVSVVGKVTNSGDFGWKDVNFQVDFFDEEGQLVDAGQELKYGYILPSHKEISFKVSFGREFPEQSYFAHKVHVISAKDARAKF